MKLVEITPISAGVQKDSLTYFSSKEVSIGDLVTVEVRKKIINALVTDVTSLDRSKVDIKRANFGMKKISSVVGHSKFYQEFFESCKETRKHFIGNLGQVINYFLPIEILKNYEKIASPNKRLGILNKNEFSALQKPLAQRINFYIKYFQEFFSNNHSVHLILPTIKEVREFDKLFKPSFKNIVTITGSEKNIVDKYTNILKETSPILIISTPSYLFIPRHDIGSIILEHESSSSYRTIKMPYFDIRTFVLFLGRNLGVNLLFSDTVLSIETIAKIKNKKTLEFNLTEHTPKIEVVDMTNKELLYKKSFVISEPTANLIKESGQTFLFTLRKGLATQVVCHDCKNVLTDNGDPLVLHERDGKRILRNSYTKKLMDINLRCTNCGSWNFDSLGIGTETVIEEIRKLFPNKQVFHIDKEVTKSEKSSRQVFDQFCTSKDSILVGTEMALNYLNKEIDNSVIISIETLQNIPSYKSYERMLHLSLGILSKTQKRFIIQTRSPDNPVLTGIASNKLENFLNEELGRRQIYGYPPFTTVIKLTNLSKENSALGYMAIINDYLKQYDPIVHKSRRGLYIETNIVLKIPLNIWNEGSIYEKPQEDSNLYKILSDLGPTWQIRLNPENLF